jgi:hypothetical protein
VIQYIQGFMFAKSFGEKESKPVVDSAEPLGLRFSQSTPEVEVSEMIFEEEHGKFQHNYRGTLEIHKTPIRYQRRNCGLNFSRLQEPGYLV